MEKGNLYHFIYKTTNLKNGKFYIGMHSTNNLDDGYLGSGKHLRNSVYYHGKENFKREILEFLPDRNSLREKEKEIITLDLITDYLCMNIQIGGGGGLNIMSDEILLRIRNAASKYMLKKWKDPEYRNKTEKILLNNTYESHRLGKIKYNTFTGKHHTDDTKKTIGIKNSVTQKGDKNSQFGTCWITNGILNKKIKKDDFHLFENNKWFFGRTIVNNTIIK